jgi:hypothetical protein
MKQGLEGATNDAKNFKDSFERSMRETKGAVKDVAGSIDGIGRAFEGSIQGAIAGFKDFVGLLSTSPWAAWGAGVAGIITGVAKLYESQVEKIADSEDKIGRARAKNRADFKKSIGIDSDSADKALASGKEVAEAMRVEKEKQVLALTKQIEENTRKVSVLKQSEIMWADEIKSINEETAMLEEKRGDASRELIKLNEGIVKLKEKDADSEKKSADDALDIERKKVEKFNERVKRYWKEVDERKKISKELEKILQDEKKRELEIIQSAEDDKAQAYKRREGTADFSRGIDIYQRMGGRIGANLDVGRLSRQTEQEKIQAEIKEINKKMEEHLLKIRQNADDQVKQLKQQQEESPF